MAGLMFEEAQVAATLSRCPWDARVLFAATCAERLAPSYPSFAALTKRGNPAALEDFLSRLWEDLSGHRLEADEVEALVTECMELLAMVADEPWVDGQSQAEDAVTAVAYAVRCRHSGDAHEAAWSARVVLESVAEYVTTRDRIDPESPEITLMHPLVQAELSRQRRDLDELTGVTEAGISKAVSRFRDRARQEAAIVFSRPM